jgi:hypothetical protein
MDETSLGSNELNVTWDAFKSHRIQGTAILGLILLMDTINALSILKIVGGMINTF